MQMIALIVVNLNVLETAVPLIQDLGKRHIGYGVTPGDYQSVNNALIFALGEGLGYDFTPAVQEAWQAVFDFIVSTAMSVPET